MNLAKSLLWPASPLVLSGLSIRRVSGRLVQLADGALTYK